MRVPMRFGKRTDSSSQDLGGGGGTRNTIQRSGIPRYSAIAYNLCSFLNNGTFPWYLLSNVKLCECDRKILAPGGRRT